MYNRFIDISTRITYPNLLNINLGHITRSTNKIHKLNSNIIHNLSPKRFRRTISRFTTFTIHFSNITSNKFSIIKRPILNRRHFRTNTSNNSQNSRFITNITSRQTLRIVKLFSTIRRHIRHNNRTYNLNIKVIRTSTSSKVIQIRPNNLTTSKVGIHNRLTQRSPSRRRNRRDHNNRRNRKPMTRPLRSTIPSNRCRALHTNLSNIQNQGNTNRITKIHIT